VKLSTRTVTVPLRVPFAAAHGTVDERELVLVGLEAGDGSVGYGEAAPLPSYDGVSAEEVREALEACRAELADYPGHAPIADVIARCGERTVLAQALAAIDLALWDLAGRRTSEPVWRLLGARDAPPVAVNATIGAQDRSGAALQAAAARADGYGTVKVKVGIGDDAGRLAAVRAFAGPQMAIRIDANGAWDHAQAVASLGAFAPIGIELCEEPVHGADAIAALAAGTEIPLALDESTTEPLAFAGRARAGLACLKIAGCGGISGTLAAAARARAAGFEVYLASTFDGPLGIAAALHVAALIRPRRACGLATLGMFADRPDPFAPRRGSIVTPMTPGLGSGLADWY
jgi:o-succinylbenzoate synthase